MRTILFIDNTYPQPYQVSTLDEQAIGGTELSVIKTAMILSSHYHVYVAQKSRKVDHKECDTLSFIPLMSIAKLKPNHIVVLRKFPLLKTLYKEFPNAHLYLWIHTYKNIEYVAKRFGLSKAKVTIICNSKTHQKHTDNILNKTFLARLFKLFSRNTPVNYCYNPVAKATQEITFEKKSKSKLLFFSSPNKGLEQVLSCFNQLLKKQAELELFVANPGYKFDDKLEIELNNNQNIILLGSLPYQEMMRHVAQSLCVFYPQDSFAETFGLIYAQANAHGTAVLAHDIGSAVEVLDKNNPTIDVNNMQSVIETIKLWQNNYPNIGYNEKFGEKNILQQWQDLFELKKN